MKEELFNMTRARDKQSESPTGIELYIKESDHPFNIA